MAHNPDLGETADDTLDVLVAGSMPIPGVVVIHAHGRPEIRVFQLIDGQLVLGRDHTSPLFQEDSRLSRSHAAISFDGARWSVRDLQSRNGTFVDAQQVHGAVQMPQIRTVRIGRMLLLPTTDVRRFVADISAGTLQREDGMVAGPSTRAVLAAIRHAGAGETLLVTGESGTGKELASRAFHGASVPAGAPLVPVNCAAIPQGVAERLLFGARKGAFSGATADVGGYVQAAEDGVLFLDEIGELDLEVQAKILRMIESREVVPLGASTARKVKVKICLATHRDLRRAVADGRFRADLFYRISEPHVVLPPLRTRPEEIPWLLAREFARSGPQLAADVRLVEACVLRQWPGNVRELMGAASRAAQQARGAREETVRLEHLDPLAGRAMTETLPTHLASQEVAIPQRPAGSAPRGERHTDPGPEAPAPPQEPQRELSREAVEAALQGQGGNVAATARALGLHRTQLYRLLKRFGLGGDGPSQ